MRLPKAWVPKSGKVVLHREANRIIITEQGADLRQIAADFSDDGIIAFERPTQPLARAAKKL